jgi:hypothetical protein
MPHRFYCAAALIILLGATVPGAAQTTPTPQRACSDEQRSQAGPNAARPAEPGNQNLSEKLAQSGGVICPPDIDPDIKVPTPEGGKMPIIPPPGSPGGDPSVQPKP